MVEQLRKLRVFLPRGRRAESVKNGSVVDVTADWHSRNYQ